MTDATSDTIPESVRSNWFWYFALGILFVFGGAFAFYVPFEASVAVTLIVGAFFLAGGIVGIIQTFMMDAGWRGRLIHMAISILNIIAGLFLLFKPMEGLVALTLVVLLNMIVGGAFRMVLGFQVRPEAGWGWLLGGGAVSILAAIYLFTQFPEISLVLLGIFAGVSLISEGVAYIMFAFGLKRSIEGK